jgi:hypothetical protein
VVRRVLEGLIELVEGQDEMSSGPFEIQTSVQTRFLGRARDWNIHHMFPGIQHDPILLQTGTTEKRRNLAGFALVVLLDYVAPVA